MAKKLTSDDKTREKPADAAAEAEPEIALDNLPFINHGEDSDDKTDWSNVDPSSIGMNFEVVEDMPKPKKAPKKKRLDSISKFITGRSPHLSYVLSTKVKPYTTKKVVPLNATTKVSAKEKTQWAASLSKNIKTVSTFFEKELLPITSALVSATMDSQERYTQLVDDPAAKLPLAYVLKKARLAAQLKICDHIAQVMKLSPENRRILKLEFTRAHAEKTVALPSDPPASASVPPSTSTSK